MYILTLTLHSYTRWLVLIAMIYALFRAWRGLIGKREWHSLDDFANRCFAGLISLQFILGVVLFLLPNGLAYAARQAAAQNFSAAMKVYDLRFFGMEHPLQMVIALAIVHLGYARARKAQASASQFRWAAICFTIAAILILIAVPWWRPFLRGIA
ncbi:MAG: hypothetical protein KIH69_011400 [Anaerolineae bacterium]|nr:hypothetical protein [Anaerolineae bacterium]